MIRVFGLEDWTKKNYNDSVAEELKKICNESKNPRTEMLKMINKRKIAQVKRVAEAYLVLENKVARKYKKYRIDAVCIVLDQEKNIERINHYENIY